MFEKKTVISSPEMSEQDEGDKDIGGRTYDALLRSPRDWDLFLLGRSGNDLYLKAITPLMENSGEGGGEPRHRQRVD